MVVWNIVKWISNSAAKKISSFSIFLDYAVSCELDEKTKNVRIGYVMWNQCNNSSAKGKLFPELFNLKDFVAVSVVHVSC